MGLLQRAKQAARVTWDKSRKAARAIWVKSRVAWRKFRAAGLRHRQRAADSRAAALAGKVERDARRKAELDATFRTQVMSYRTKRNFERDAQRRHAEGWRMTGQSQQPSRAKVGSKVAEAGCLGLMSGGLGCLSIFVPMRTHPPITVTWVKDPVSPPGRLSVEPAAQDSETSAPIASQLAALGELHATGVLTDEEFSAKKAELLARM